MSIENDPFELLKKKLEAKKKGTPAPAEQKVPERPVPRPVPPAGQARPAQPAPSPRPRPGQPQPVRKPGFPSPGPAAVKPGAPAADPGAPPKRLQKGLFAKEDVQKMARSNEKVSGDVPDHFVSHRFDAKVDRQNKKVVSKKTKIQTQRPKGFSSDRFDRS